MSLVTVLKQLSPNLTDKSIYELSSRGALFRMLRRRAGHLTISEFFDHVAPGDYDKGVQCQDLQALTFTDKSFDICTSTEVFEHVPDDRQAFREVYRVLKDDGVLIFTVPLNDKGPTIERARMESGRIVHLKPEQYHSDRLRGAGQVLCYRNYGADITDRLEEAGFSSARIVRLESKLWWGLSVPVIIARKTSPPAENA